MKSSKLQSVLINMGVFAIVITLLIFFSLGSRSSRASSVASPYPTIEYVKTTSGNELSNQEILDEAYEKGYSAGYSDGVSEKSAADHNAAYSEGFNNGYDYGYPIGFEESRQQVFDYITEPIMNDYGIDIEIYSELLPSLP